MSSRRITAEALATALAGAMPPALLDIRDPVEAERGHIPGGTNLPRRRIEFRIADLIRDPATPIVVSGDADVRAELAAATLSSLGYRNVSWLDGGVSAWQRTGRALASGNNVPSKAFGERVQHMHDVPAIDAATLLRWRAEGRRVAVLDVRTPGEHVQGCIPGASSAPSFDVALRAADLAAGHDMLVLHCAGRTRSIIGTRTLIEMGVANVVALENGTMGWRLAGHEVVRGSLAPPAGQETTATNESRERAEKSAHALAEAEGVRRIDADTLLQLQADTRRNLYVFDVRSLPEHDAGHVAGCQAVPGGQVVQRADDFIAVRTAPVVLIDEQEARAHLTGLWLRRMGFGDVAVLAGGMQAWRASGRAMNRGRARSKPLGLSDARACGTGLAVDALAAWQAAYPDVCSIHVDTSASFREGHLSGATWLPRGWLEPRIEALAPDRTQPVLVSCADGVQSIYAVATLTRMGYRMVCRLDGGTRAWKAAGHALEPGSLPAQDDELLAPYQRGEQAMRDYIAWEKLLVPGHSTQPMRPS